MSTERNLILLEKAREKRYLWNYWVVDKDIELFLKLGKDINGILPTIEDTNLNQVTLYLKMIPAIGDKLKKKSAENQNVLLSERQRQILECMELEVLYKSEEIAEKVGLKGPRTRQLLNELVAMGILTCTAATKNRRYIRTE